MAVDVMAGNRLDTWPLDSRGDSGTDFRLLSLDDEQWRKCLACNRESAVAPPGLNLLPDWVGPCQPSQFQILNCLPSKSTLLPGPSCPAIAPIQIYRLLD